jgi:hypothetical protein
VGDFTIFQSESVQSLSNPKSFNGFPRDSEMGRNPHKIRQGFVGSALAAPTWVFSHVSFSLRIQLKRSRYTRPSSACLHGSCPATALPRRAERASRGALGAYPIATAHPAPAPRPGGFRQARAKVLPRVSAPHSRRH